MANKKESWYNKQFASHEKRYKEILANEQFPEFLQNTELAKEYQKIIKKRNKSK
jgi:hypothetical protein